MAICSTETAVRAAAVSSGRARAEVCDDGNLRAGDGCSEHCRVEPGWRCDATDTGTECAAVCGDGVAVPGEHCDDGQNALVYGFGCGPECQRAPYCGDGHVDAVFGEECDDGVALNRGLYGGCAADCRRSAYCGDGVVDVEFGELCDAGNSGGSRVDCPDTCVLEVP
jgi:cysteine-rich repeat protein